jgi:ribulose-5-phosphate 4-epimerase/fuculose-1-phosphate aldolase
MTEAPGRVRNLAPPPTFATIEEERRYRKTHLAGAFRLFAKFGFDEGAAGHITARDPERPDWFWVNPFGMHFSQIRVSDLVLVNEHGEVVQGDRRLFRLPYFRFKAPKCSLNCATVFATSH